MSTRSDTPHLAPPLSAVLLASARVVEDVLEGRSMTDALADVDGALRPAAQAVSFHAMRYLGWADAVGRELVQRYPPTTTISAFSPSNVTVQPFS